MHCMLAPLPNCTGIYYLKSHDHMYISVLHTQLWQKLLGRSNRHTCLKEI